MEQWIVVETKPRQEHLAKFWLERAGYECYLPLVVSGDDTQPRPMLPRYVFANLEPMNGRWIPILSTIGVTGPIRIAGVPCKLPSRDIEAMRRREEAGVIRLKRQQAIADLPDLDKGQRVKVHDGLYTGFDAIFDRKDGKDRVRVFISYLGSLLPFTMPRENVA